MIGLAIAGSPPRVRGTGDACGVAPGFCGITPACAGNSGASLTGTTKLKDHPRVCGEQCYMRTTKMVSVGSPPRVRGTDWPPKKVAASRRITPACAGNRTERFPLLWTLRDHPRVCGEQNSVR